MDMGWRVSFFDMISYLIPGGLAILAFLWFADGFIGSTLPHWDLNSGFAILFLAAAYIAGHIVQWFAAGNRQRQLKKWGGRPEEIFLKLNDAHYLPEFKSALTRSIDTLFGIGLLNDSDSSDSARRLSAYSLCRTFLLQRSLAAEAECYRHLSRLYAGLLQICRLTGTVSGLITLKHLVLLMLPAFAIFVPVTGFLAYEEIELTYGILLVVLAMLARRPVQSHVKRYAEAEVDSIYYGILSWYQTQRIEPTHA